ncbi:MAG: NADH:ubiquinone reductase (Na(+)-transporting) subunit A [Simkaniaceae bacterium]|nr:NADH:ubiquinone reductase (Na(+)-transporting) subunit A [Simkaniaceae bacterium]
MHIRVKKGLDIPILGKPGHELRESRTVNRVALDLTPFPSTRFSLLAHEGDRVKIGQPLACDKSNTNRFFVSPAGGKLVEVQRGEKRRLLKIVIEIDGPEEALNWPALTANASQDEVVERMLETGIFARILKRPCNILANPGQLPNAVFINGAPSAPFSPPPQVEGSDFIHGLEALKKLCDTVHLIHPKSTTLPQVDGIQVHTVEGAHPAGNSSLHIFHIAPIKDLRQIYWTLSLHDVECLGRAISGEIKTDRLVSVAGEGFDESVRGLYRVREGTSILQLFSQLPENSRILSGNPLMGASAEYLGLFDDVICAIKRSEGRDLLHFCGLGFNRYTASKTYLSSLFRKKEFSFTTNQHGEQRAFVDSGYYDRFLPMKIPVSSLIKAILAEDYELAMNLGLLEVAPEDFALPTFADPSNIDMVEIVRKGLSDLSEQYV